jgi:hypothetical protein
MQTLRHVFKLLILKGYNDLTWRKQPNSNGLVHPNGSACFFTVRSSGADSCGPIYHHWLLHSKAM